MLPPNFVKQLDARGLDPPHCGWCVHVAVSNRDEICVKYGAHVLLYSSCGSYMKRVGSDPPVLKEEEVRERFNSGLVDLRK